MSELSFIHRYEPPAHPGAPTLLLLHGTGGDENDLVPLVHELMPGAGALSPRGQVLERGMPRFFRRLAEGVFDVDDLKRRTVDLADFIGAAATRYGFNPRTVIAVGFSNGANIAASLLLMRPGTLGGAVLFRAMVPFVPDAADARAVGEAGGIGGAGAPRSASATAGATTASAAEASPGWGAPTPVLLSNGRADPLVAAEETERLAALLRGAGADVTLEWQPAGHNLTAGDVAKARAWLASLGW